ncbi:MAG TPA: hypothetical protein VF743_01905, partial [Acidimicrobiales bacterium]
MATEAPASDPTAARVGRAGLAYCTPTSVLPGEPVAVHVSCPGGTVDVEVGRDGARPEVVWRAADVPVDVLEVPPDAPERGCRWPPALTVPTGRGWRSGLHLVRL